MRCVQRPLQVALADFGNAMLASLDAQVEPRREKDTVPVCTPFYRPPDVLLGSCRVGPSLDMWSMGCAAAELFLRRPLFRCEPLPGRSAEKAILDMQFLVLGTPATGTPARSWLTSLPFTAKFYGAGGLILPARSDATALEMQNFFGAFPEHLADFVGRNLQWDPLGRSSAAEASRHAFLCASPLAASAAVRDGKNGESSIVSGVLDRDVLEYLQGCPSWAPLLEECRRSDFACSRGLSPEESARRKKGEFPGFVDEMNPPKCRDLNAEKDIPLVISPRVSHFAKAFRRGAQDWLHQLTSRIRSEIRRQGIPTAFLDSNGGPFLDEDMAENAWVYASVQVLKVGKRIDGWHTDGGASLLHCGLTIFGSRAVEVEFEGGGCISLAQRPGSFYAGNLCAARHCVTHGETSEGCFGDGLASERVGIAVMLRSDVFRDARARRKDAVPGPKELFRVVNAVTARHLAEVPLYLPDIAAVLAEVPKDDPELQVSSHGLPTQGQ